MVPGQLDLGWSMWCSKGTLFRSSLGQEEEVAKCLLQGQKKASRRDDLAVGVQQIANPFGVASQHKFLEQDIGLVPRECLCVLGPRCSEAGIGSVLLSTSLKPELRELR